MRSARSGPCRRPQPAIDSGLDIFYTAQRACAGPNLLTRDVKEQLDAISKGLLLTLFRRVVTCRFRHAPSRTGLRRRKRANGGDEKKALRRGAIRGRTVESFVPAPD